MSYKYCIVPKCNNTSINTSNKLFFHVPKEPNARKKWCSVIKRKPLASKSTKYCCEDHFDVETDVENYIRYRMLGGNLRLRKGVIPHKFSCDSDTALVKQPESKKNDQIQIFEKVFIQDSDGEHLIMQQELIKREPMDSDSNEIEADCNISAKANMEPTANYCRAITILVQPNKESKVGSLDIDPTTDGSKVRNKKKVKRKPKSSRVIAQ